MFVSRVVYFYLRRYETSYDEIRISGVVQWDAICAEAGVRAKCSCSRKEAGLLRRRQKWGLTAQFGVGVRYGRRCRVQEEEKVEVVMRLQTMQCIKKKDHVVCLAGETGFLGVERT